MSTKEELEKLTVINIKEKLKSRKLPVNGSKAELINRLYDSLMAEEKLLEEGPGGGGEESIDLSSVNMDEVLGLDDEKDTHSSTTANDDIERKEKQSASFDDDQLKLDEPTIIKEELTKEDDESKKTDDLTTKRKGKTDDDVKLLKNAQSLGLPLKRSATAPTESDDILAKREKRFGPGLKDGTKVGITKINEEEAKEKRAARFGLPNEKKEKIDEDAKMLKRAERFGLPLLKKGGETIDNAEVLAKREKRFGSVMGSGEDTETKKEARIKRFGVVS